MFPFLFDNAIELGPQSGTPQYQLTSSASEPSAEFMAIIDCFNRSATQQVFLVASQTKDLIWPLILVNSFSWPYEYLSISPLNEESKILSSTSMGEQMLLFTYKIFYELARENIIYLAVCFIFDKQVSFTNQNLQIKQFGLFCFHQVKQLYYKLIKIIDKSLRQNYPFLAVLLPIMLPRANKYFKPTIPVESRSNQLNFSKDRLELNRSTQLPQTKKINFNQFSILNVDKKRPSLIINSPYKRRGKFFTEQSQTVMKVKKQFDPEQEQSASLGKNYNSVGQIVGSQKSPKMRQRLIKQIYERQSSRIRKIQEATSLQKSRNVANSSSTNHTCCFITPQQLFKLTNNLTDYEIQEILPFQEVYYYGQNCKNKKFTKAQIQNINKQEQYPFEKGDHVMYRYEIIESLGEGSFGQVFKCYDYRRNKQPVALKIVKYNQKYAEQAKSQISILSQIKREDPTSSKNCIQIKDCFVWRDRVCMTFDLLSINLYQLVKSNGYYGLPLDLIRRFVLQILNAIHFLHKEKIIHADLKPENILLKQPNKSGVRIIDFGSSCFQNKTIYTYIQSRYYRAPQVILGMGYNRKIDIWSFGCIIAQLHLGYPLFAGDDEHQQMCFIVQVLGLPPTQLKNTSKRWHVFFDERDNLKQHPKKAKPGSKSWFEVLQKPEDEGFIRFLKRCLQWNPCQRVQALDLLKDEWVVKGLPQQFKQQHLKFITQQQQQQISNNRISKYKKIKSKSFCIRQNASKFLNK